ncbi:NuoM family protein [Campylobacter sp. 19-13652]|uniref:complex I subunit 4 family protein n=1 Tax=Campylobacter sp. 19-13652 TaxID=2840180 RepID=UPI001C7548B2|nr:NADH-quinone oxidoreductase subunit M [Campylobacter sp. 19-13652]BCX78745.1 NADH-quinone oxidoreductase subunit M [Campylobacter sp. 19-13652]
MLSLIIFFPALAALLGFFIDDKNAKTYGVLAALLEFVFVLWGFGAGDFTQGYALMQSSELVSSIGVNYLVGVDGISYSLILLASLVVLISLLAAPSSKMIAVCVLAFEASMIGAFSSLDGILFYMFWELNLIPTFYLIGFYTKSKDASKAAFKFFVYGFAGSVFLLLGIIYMAYLCMEQNGNFSFSLLDWTELDIPTNAQIWLFLAFGISFAVKSPLFPFHTWLPTAHKVAPTVASMLLALKMGTYGFIRFSLPLFPDAAAYFYPVIAVLAIITIIYGAFVAFAQDDIKMTIAYSTFSHSGLVVLSIFALSYEGIAGAVYLMLAHGLVATVLFMLIGILADQRGSRKIKDFGAVAKSMPIFASVFALMMLSYIGLPLTAGFVGEFLALLAAFKLSFYYGLFGAIAIIVGAAYMLNLFREVIFNEESGFKFKDICYVKKLILLPLCAVVLVLGVYPAILLDDINIAAKDSIFKMLKNSSQSTKELIKNLNEGAAE